MQILVIASLLLLCAPAVAQPVISAGLDGGLTQYEANVETLDGPGTQRGTGISLGLDLLSFLWAFDDFMVGLTFEGSFFQAGPEPSPAIEFLVGPRVGWRAHDWLHLQASGGVLLSTFSDRCGGEFDPPICDVATRSSEPASVGWGFTFSPMIPFDFEGVGTLIVGPTVRHRRANVAYDDGGGGAFYLRTWQFALGAHFIVPLGE